MDFQLPRAKQWNIKVLDFGFMKVLAFIHNSRMGY